MTQPATIQGKDAVVAAMSEYPAVKALVASIAASFLDARFDRGELTLTVAPGSIKTALAALQSAGYNFFDDMTAVDWHPASPRFQLSYHLLSHRFREYIRVAARVDGDRPEIDSITSIWPAANFYEREVFDLFGIRFNGHPDLRRIMMPDDWQGHPLRKDYPVEGYR